MASKSRQHKVWNRFFERKKEYEQKRKLLQKKATEIAFKNDNYFQSLIIYVCNQSNISTIHSNDENANEMIISAIISLVLIKI